MARITVLAGTNGAGKSSIAGARLRETGGAWFDPDDATRRILAANPGMDLAAANGAAWSEGIRRLRHAIDTDSDYVFETTLGGRTVTGLLHEAAAAGMALWIWYCGLDSPARHLARIRSRVAHGGHDIPEQRVRERYDASRKNLIRLLAEAAVVHVYDNSAEADPKTGRAPEPALVLHLAQGKLAYPRTPTQLASIPDWAKPIVASAWRRVRR